MKHWGKIRLKIIELHNQGKTVNEMVDIMGLTKENIRNQLSAMGMKSNKIKKVENPMLQKTKELYEEGKSVDEMMVIMKRSRSSIEKYHIALGLKWSCKKKKQTVSNIELSEDIIERCKKAMEISTKCREWEVAYDNEQYYY